MEKVVLFSYHANFATSEYLARAIAQDSFELKKIGICHPDSCPNPAPSLQDLLRRIFPRYFLFVDPPGPIWPLGFESLTCASIAYLIDVHLGLSVRKAYAPFFDHIFLAQKDYVDEFRREGFESVHWLPLACDPQVHRCEPAERNIDVAFVGKMGSRGSIRHVVLSTVLPQFRTNEYWRFHSPEEMSLVYSRSKIVLNASINGDLNMRFFEALASGSLLVTDRISNGLSSLFQENVHYVGYSTVEEAVAKIRHYIGHPEERERIARAGQAVTLSDHTYLARWRTILKIIGSCENQRAALIRSYSPDRTGKAYAQVYEMLRIPSGVSRLIAQSSNKLRDRHLLRYLLNASFRKLNAWVPLTPGAIRARMGK